MIIKKKVVLAGNSGVGKTTLAKRLSGSTGSPTRMTVGVEFFTFKEGDVKLVVFDLAGQDRFKPVVKGMGRGASLVLLVFDVSRPSTLHSLREWVEVAGASNAKVLLVGNKLDLGSKVTEEELERIAQEIGAAGIILVSASTGEGLDRLKQALLRL